jgi:anaerobic ribonucleoside-triphosphate reductase
MAEYLEKEAFKSWLKENITKNPMILTAVDYAPPADVEPVRHGYWQVGYFHEVCSCCTHPDNLDDYPHLYCPNCGAKMDEEERK